MSEDHPASPAVLDRLYETVMARKGAHPSDSYTAKLFSKGTKKIAQKLGEEAVEAVIEVIKGDRERLAEESADLLYHLVVAWADTKVRPQDVYRKLAEREGISGLEEKKARKRDGKNGKPEKT